MHVCFDLDFYLPRYEASVADNISMSGTVHGVRYLSVCLQILNSFNVSGIDEVRSSNLANGSSMEGFTRGEKCALKGALIWSRDLLQNLKPS